MNHLNQLKYSYVTASTDIIIANVMEMEERKMNDFEKFKKFNFKKHINLQLGAGIDKRFETLLNNSKINPNNRYKSVSGICQYWGKAV